MEEKRSKKALWVSEDMHREINIFAATREVKIYYLFSQSINPMKLYLP